MNKQQFLSKHLLSIFNKRYLTYLSITFLILILIPIGFYIYNFWCDWSLSDGVFSEDKDDWGTFGDFLGGTLNTIFNFLIILFSIINLYLSIALTLKVHEESQEMQKKQVIPYALINTYYDSENFRLEIKNAGLGPLIVKNFTCTHLDTQMQSKYIHELINLKDFELIKPYVTFLKFTKMVISPNETVNLFSISSKNSSKAIHDNSAIFLIDMIRHNLNRTKLELEYTDIYQNKYPNDYVIFSVDN